MAVVLRDDRIDLSVLSRVLARPRHACALRTLRRDQYVKERNAILLTPTLPRWRALLTMFCLILAGEVIFSLPFHITRFFRPTALAGFGLGNAALGDIFAVYGVTAMLAYFPGGALADRFSTRILISGSLLATAAGGLYFSTLPGARGMAWLYGYWGLTTILLFWAALIRATREWGGPLTQGRAFGLLEGGRGLVAAGLASFAVALLTFTPATGTDPSALTSAAALVRLIYFYTAITATAGVLCAFAIPASSHERTVTHAGFALDLVREPTLWLQALIVVAAYCGYKSLDYFSLYAHDMLGMNEVAAARFSATTGYLRPLCALAAGWLADRTRASTITLTLFAIGAASYGVLPRNPLQTLLYVNVLVTIAVIYSLRGIYFALLQESAVPKHFTGTAVGFISVLGYTPDVFFAPIAGRLLDQAPGVIGYRHLFELLLVIFVIGGSAVIALRHLIARRQHLK